nr:immunoglobulin heavy chain junction region [Macaca mulatta]MOV48996.1 immunoglobulin heavy chain junction region [Macaca mulatta]MOV49410.1 immunoglobulin heavy chain junction region [Macaca mulatta]MOV49490.1 immunoglobulin heavy chain junction region [Macaca mulatta]MOV49592.1 immunoglobulin heavy chain junction region [Macaca mulatta]
CASIGIGSWSGDYW